MSNYVKRYAPACLKGNDTADNLALVENIEVEKLYEKIRLVFKNFFIATTNLETIKKWEKVLNLVIDNSVHIEIRRENVYHKLACRPPYTRAYLDHLLREMFGDDFYILAIDYDELDVLIECETPPTEMPYGFEKKLRLIIPANLYLRFSLPFTYEYLGINYTYGQLGDYIYADYNLKPNYTYGQLKAYTYGDLNLTKNRHHYGPYIITYGYLSQYSDLGY